MGVYEGRINKNKVQWKQGTKAREQGTRNKENKEQGHGGRPARLLFLGARILYQK